MKTKLLKLAGISLLLLFSANAFAQTDGTLTFTFTRGKSPYYGLFVPDIPLTTPPTYVNKITPATTTTKGDALISAVWIEKADGTFIKTFIRYCAGEGDHLPAFTVASGGYHLGDIVPPATTASTKYYAMDPSCNVIGAVTGATRFSNVTATGTATTPGAWNETTSITWDGKDTAGNIVPDGVYKIWIEAAWKYKNTYENPTTSVAKNYDDQLIGFTFNKGTLNETTTPTGDAYVNTVSTVWTAKVLGINSVSKNSKVSIYPNPSNGVFNIDFNNVTVSKIDVANILGQKVFSKIVDKTKSESNISIDLSNNPNGVYIINASNDKETKSYKVVLNK
jgi:hypothetical protein